MIDTQIFSRSAGLLGALSNTGVALTIMLSTLTGCGGAWDSDGSFATTVASTAGVMASNETEAARKNKKLAEPTTDIESGATSTGSTAETASTATTTSPAPTTSTATDVTVAATTTNVTGSTTTSTSSAPALDVASDPRTRYWVDGDKLASEHPSSVNVMLHSGSAAVSPNTGSMPTRLNQLSPAGYLHADGSAWIKREQRSDGKWAFTQRLKAGQALYTNWSGAPTGGGDNTARAIIGMQEGPGFENVMIDERGGDYWFAQELWFDADGASLGGFGSDAHDITWREAPYASYGFGFGNILGSNYLYFVIAGPYVGQGYEYDVRNGPSAVPVNNAQTGGQWGTSQWWRIADNTRGVPIKLVWRIKCGNTASDNPRLELWRKIGNGSMIKLIDSNLPNVGTDGFRYWKSGGYIWGLGADGYTGPTRTSRLRSSVVMNNVNITGQANINADALMAWLER
jgi:hypothetical protein